MSLQLLEQCFFRGIQGYLIVSVSFVLFVSSHLIPMYAYYGLVFNLIITYVIMVSLDI